jgi:hypothetical protein
MCPCEAYLRAAMALDAAPRSWVQRRTWRAWFRCWAGDVRQTRHTQSRPCGWSPPVGPTEPSPPLVLSQRTVDRHVSNVFTKLGLSSRAGGAAYAYEHQLV